MRLPAATYRLQFNGSFTLADAHALLAYFESLGVSDLYASPIFAARAGSNHGYDVIDPRRVNPEIGSLDDLRALGAALRERGMGLVLDVVPNHMCINDPGNTWWQDVLENGPASPYASYFDIDWHPPKPDLANKVLVPMLGAQYGWVVEQHELVVRLSSDGAFHLHYGAMSMPLAPKSWTFILQPALRSLTESRGEDDADVVELESILNAIEYLPSRTEIAPERVRVRQREKRVIKRRVAALLAASPWVRDAVDASIAGLNGETGDPAELPRLEALLDEQAYRLSFWRVASEEINYRRFFDVNDLAAIRVEEPEVFRAVHELAFQLAHEGIVTGFRIDHVDGLRDPEGYLRQLQAELAPDERESFYVVVEKILLGDEHLRASWPVAGTTGYEVQGLLDRVLTDPSGEAPLRAMYERFARANPSYDDVAYQSRKLVLQASLRSELTVLARRLDRISEQHRYTRDFTLQGLQDALREVIACFPVYRTYAAPNGEPVGPDDRAYVAQAVEDAQLRNPTTSASIFEFVGTLLTLEHPPGLTAEQEAERRDFVLRTQQLTSAVMAKGTEDTAFYRWYPLAPLDDVGGAPDRFHVPLEEFHEANRERLERAPAGLVTTSTHDSKRGEEVRARIRVLAEIPDEWSAALQRWHDWNRPLKTMRRTLEMPDRNAEYLLYQTLIGTWPPGQRADMLVSDTYVERVQRYMEKALREAKVHTSWINPWDTYERAVQDFVRGILAAPGASDFLPDLVAFVERALPSGLWSCLAEVLLKITIPGAPDFYQGTELWEYRLVDPDNRAPVDFACREAMLREIDEIEQRDGTALLDTLARRPEDPRLKLWITSRALRFRKREATLFHRGLYEPVAVRGARADYVVAFARRLDGREVVVATARWFARLMSNGAPPLREAWGQTTLQVPEATADTHYRELFTGAEISAVPDGAAGRIRLADAFARLPLALLERVA